MARATSQSQPFHRSASSSTSSRHSRNPSSSSSIHTNPDVQTSSSSSSQQTKGAHNGNKHAKTSPSSLISSSGNKKVTSTATLPFLLSIPLFILHFIYRLLRISGESDNEQQSSSSSSSMDDLDNSNDDNIVTSDDVMDALSGRTKSGDGDNDDDYLAVMASPALTTLLDDALYRAYQAELVPTVAAASQLLAEFIQMKEAAALILRECRWMVGVPMSGGIAILLHSPANGSSGGGQDGAKEIAVGDTVVKNKSSIHGFYSGGGVIADKTGHPTWVSFDDDGTTLQRAGDGVDSASSSAASELRHVEEMTRWNEFDTIQDFAQQCYVSANEAIQRLTTDRLAESANLTLQDSITASTEGSDTGGNGGGGIQNDGSGLPQSPSQGGAQSSSPSSSSHLASAASMSTFPSPADAGIGRCYHAQPRRDCWESPRLYCPDYYWADDAIGGCQRLLKTLSKHRFVTLVNTHGWERYSAIKPRTIEPDATKLKQPSNVQNIHAPTYASATPHVFPSLEAIHSLQYLVSEQLPTSIPSRLNQFRAAVESNAVVSKRLYLVKCEYRAPMRALWESFMNLNAAPKVELVERYLRDYHGVKVGDSNKGGSSADAGGEVAVSSGRGSGLRRKGSTEVTKKSAIQQQREELEKLITGENYWKHPHFVQALQLERCCERMEIEMSQMLLPLANLAAEIMNEWKGRLKAVAVVDYVAQDDEEEMSSDPSDDGHDFYTVALGWKDVPYMRELLRRLKSILRRKPDLDESTGIRPLLLDLQGVPRHKQDPIDSSIEMSFYPPSSSKPTLFGRFASDKAGDDNDQWFQLEQFIAEIRKLLELLNIPNIPFLVEERLAGSKGDKNTLLDLIGQCNEVWDEDMFRAQYQDWFDMVKLQQDLNAGRGISSMDDNAQESQPTSLSELSETIREAEIELSIAMASKDQLERVHKHLEALRKDKLARYKVLAQIVFDIGYRELNDGIVIEPPADDATVEFPKLTIPGVFGDQLTLSGEVLPVG